MYFQKDFDGNDNGFNMLNDDLSTPLTFNITTNDMDSPFMNTVNPFFERSKSPLHFDFTDTIDETFSVPMDIFDNITTPNVQDDFGLTIQPGFFDSAPIAMPTAETSVSPQQADQSNFEIPLTFEEAYNDPTIVLNPVALSLLPEKYWSQQSQTMTFAQIVKEYFKQNRTQNSTFMLKLYNLLLISSQIPKLQRAIGVRWVNDSVIELSRSALINIFNVRESTVDGSMFHRQGNFPTHRFIEITDTNFQQMGFLEYGQMPRVPGDTKFFIHEPRVFTRRPMTEGELRSIKYSNEAKKTYRSKTDFNGAMIPL